jgi:hypothetical protein
MTDLDHNRNNAAGVNWVFKKEKKSREHKEETF